MRSNPLTKAQTCTDNSLIRNDGNLTIDEWIYHNIPCVLLYKDGIMDIFPTWEYTAYELEMLQQDLGYKSPWVPIHCGSFSEMQEAMYRILREGLCAVTTEPIWLSERDCPDVSVNSGLL